MLDCDLFISFWCPYFSGICHNLLLVGLVLDWESSKETVDTIARTIVEDPLMWLPVLQSLDVLVTQVHEHDIAALVSLINELHSGPNASLIFSCMA